MVEFSNINPNESGLSVRSKLNKMLRELISGVEGVNSVWNEILSLDGITDEIRSDLTAWYSELRTQILYGFDETARVSADLKSYIDGMFGGVSAFAESTSYNPQFPFEKAATVIAVQPGKYTNFKNSSGVPIVITAENALTIFYKGANSNYWKYHSIVGISVKESVDGGYAGTPGTSISLRGDTLQNWNSANPILKYREIALVFTNTSGTGVCDAVKIGDGYTHFRSLPLFGLACLSSLGQNTNFPVSQKVVTDAINGIKSDLSSLGLKVMSEDEYKEIDVPSDNILYFVYEEE